MDTLTDRVHVLGEKHPSSQPSRLCHACQSVLTRDDLEAHKKYTHHSSLDAFIEANRMNCYVCSHVFRSPGSKPEDIQEILRQAAEGKTPDVVAKDETQSTDYNTSNPRVDFRHWISTFEEGREPRVSFTDLEIEYHGGRGYYLKFCIALNPFYEGFLPPNTESYDTLLSAMWHKFALAFDHVDSLLIVPDQRMSMLTLIQWDMHLLIENSIHQGISNDTRSQHRINANLVNC